ncbi:MAG: excinuclease ABC subunit UvrC [Flavobacteriales bacterium]|jgi:excinuclease ABC subunit C|nr:excinuclease ABC subunit UvrC [Flavobacteriales bacterium]
MESEDIKLLISSLPNKAGVYQYFDKNQRILYIGKAKNIKKRVSSYFTKKQQYAKTKMMVSKIRDIKYFVVPTEMDALLLENNLIKKYQPKYNIMLKDDKTYPFICVKNEPFPRVFQTRNVMKDGSDYFGPYTSIRLVRTLIDFVHQLYPLRTCNLNLKEENIQKKKFKLCLEYHIGNCLAPCESFQSEESYEIGINHIKQILKGDIKSVTSILKDRMEYHATNLEFEKAQSVKEKLVLLENYQSKSTIVNTKINNVDVFTIVSDEISAFVNYLKISNGAIIQTHTIELKKKLNESDIELLTYAITELRQRFNSLSKEIYTSESLDNLWENVKITIPKIGDKYKLIELSKRNAKYMQFDKITKKEKLREKSSDKRIVNQLQVDLNLKEKPRHIECFDNSNFQGTNAVAACVVFKNAKPSKKDYRHFNIKTVVGPDDFKSMEEVVYRRYKRLLEEKKDLPQLIIVDGGKGQLSSAAKSLEKLGLIGKIKIIGIAKKLEEIFFLNDPIPLYLDKRSESLKLIQQLRNEAHRFGITHHRKKRSKNTFTTSLDEIEGIGDKTIQTLISHFGSVEKIKTAKKEEIVKLVGESKYQKIILSLKKNK